MLLKQVKGELEHDLSDWIAARAGAVNERELLPVLLLSPGELLSFIDVGSGYLNFI